MVERQDIDALLISALYGELTPAEETRLAAHLESHPADRTALDDLTRAREVLHQSRILAFQYEPPQSISALLMQEASRRAPRKVPEGEGWFARFVRSFMVHPAMAAAAMIVVVVGAATLVSRNSDQQFAETPPVETSTYDEPAPAVAAETPDRTVSAPSAAVPTPTAALEGTADQFKVALADGEQKEPDGKLAPKADKADEKAKAEVKALPEVDPNAAFYYDSSGVKGGDAVVTKPPVAKPTKSAPDTGMELRRRDPAPKDFDAPSPDPKPPEELAKKQVEEKKRVLEAERQASERKSLEAAAPTDDAIGGNREQAGYVSDGRAYGSGAANNRTGTAGGTAAPGAAPTTPPTQPATIAQQGQTPRNAGPRTTTAPPPPKATRQEIATDSTTTGAASRDVQKSKEKNEKVANDPNLAWAKDQHAALVTAVRANNCGRAANIALAIVNRAPSYYAQNVQTDRSVKECIAYINTEREKDAEVRASRAKKSQLKNAEPAAPKRAADQPAASTDSSK